MLRSTTADRANFIAQWSHGHQQTAQGEGVHSLKWVNSGDCTNANTPIVFVENSGTGRRFESKQALTSQEVNPSAIGIAIGRRGWGEVLVISQETNGVPQCDGMVEVALSLSLCYAVHLKQ